MQCKFEIKAWYNLIWYLIIIEYLDRDRCVMPIRVNIWSKHVTEIAMTIFDKLKSFVFSLCLLLHQGNFESVEENI